ncbi:hypothetical protein BDR07DRAFT_1496105 [Suillus spraguei]|nr:hypothetical protein BDR07DRAFT_1496105 [Suillus spraguei]
MLSDPENCARLAIKPLALSTALRCDASRWKEYTTHNAFKRLCYIGDCLRDGTLQCIILPINISNLHWAIFEVDALQQEIRYGDSLDWTCPSVDIDTIHCWLKQHNFKPFHKAISMPHRAQHDSYSCGVAALNTICHAVSQTPLFADDTKDILCMEEFLVLAYSHLEKSELLGETNDSSSDTDLDIEIMDANAPVVAITPEPSSDLNLSTSTMEAETSTTKAKVHLDLHMSDEDGNGGLFKFFQKIPHEQYLKKVNIPFTWEIEHMNMMLIFCM